MVVVWPCMGLVQGGSGFMWHNVHGFYVASLGFLKEGSSSKSGLEFAELNFCKLVPKALGRRSALLLGLIDRMPDIRKLTMQSRP